MTETATAVAALKQRRPEWGPWLAVVEETLRHAEAPVWDAAVPAEVRPAAAGTPLLAGAAVTIAPRAVRDLLDRLLRVASRSGTPQMATLAAVLDRDLDVLALFKGSLCQDIEPAAAIATASRADADALHGVIALLSLPFLQTCSRRWAAARPVGWLEGYCPICGAWPAFAEARGIERNRFFRCARCGGEWPARPLRCPHCGEDDHEALVSLVPENRELNAVIEGCRSCLHYIKTFTRLQGCRPAVVMLDDLASVHLDVAMLEQGYTRPQGTGYVLDVTVSGEDAARWFPGWKV